ncbi:MAG: hypothetical protein O8C66_00195 [Candidatus Methanoperedens sp.]|nr:hypothetical protein [Candidatus Methanoperedens sp.]MCZ7368910.1 hypothetical protein [Candidatus Methanoperedens sp.]
MARSFENKKPQMKAPRVTPLEGVSTSTVAPFDVAHTYGSAIRGYRCAICPQAYVGAESRTRRVSA